MEKIIRDRVRKGEDKDGVRFEPLSEFSIRSRGSQPLHPSTRPTKSNLTLTGDLTDDILMKIIKSGKFQLTVKNRSKDKARSHITGRNEQGLSIPIRNFLGVTPTEKRRFKDIIRDALVRHLR